MNIDFYTDGSVRANGKPGPMGYSAVAVFEGRTREFRGSEWAQRATSNRAELLAIRLALLQVAPSKRARYQVVIFSDSEWSVKAIQGEYSVNHHVELVDEIRTLLKEFRQFKVCWIRGHAGNAYNERAHLLANAALSESVR